MWSTDDTPRLDCANERSGWPSTLSPRFVHSVECLNHNLMRDMPNSLLKSSGSLVAPARRGTRLPRRGAPSRDLWRARPLGNVLVDDEREVGFHMAPLDAASLAPVVYHVRIMASPS